MPRNNGSMPEIGNVSNYARTRVDELNLLFTNVSLLEQSIAEDNAEKELEAYKKLYKKKQEILEKQKKLEEAWIKRKAELEKKADKEALDRESQAYELEKKHIADIYEERAKKAQQVEKEFKDIEAKYKGSIGNLIGSFKKGAVLGSEGFSNAAVGQIVKGLSTFTKQLENSIEEIGQYQNIENY